MKGIFLIIESYLKTFVSKFVLISLTLNLTLWGHLECYMDPRGSRDDPKCIFFTLITYQTTFISDTLYLPAGIEDTFRTDGGRTDGRTDGRTEGQTRVKSEIVI